MLLLMVACVLLKFTPISLEITSYLAMTGSIFCAMLFKKLSIIEVSFPDEQPDKTLFGHLTPRLLMTEMNILGQLTGMEALKNLNIVITHLKPPYANIVKIKEQLKSENKDGLNLIYPQQGKLFNF
ncbi:MAG: 3,5-cyclic-nucleotide phosphodiesterase [Mucilaginibacter sp.]|nr:3,5-cyclic-nucleotide phosphodiesterase [Mucilaginibacter sp.]